MEIRVEILRELEEITGGIPKWGEQPDYALPEGYFANLPFLILEKIRSGSEVSRELKGLSPFLSAIPKMTPFEVPEGYFGGLEEFYRDSGGIGKDPVPPDWPKNMPFQVPGDYFMDLPSVVLFRVLQTVPARVVPIQRMHRVLRYAAAAVIAGVIALGAGLYFSHGAPSVDAQLAVIPDQAIIEYLQNPGDPLDNESIYSQIPPATQTNSLVSGLSDGDLQAYLDNTVSVSQNLLN